MRDKYFTDISHLKTPNGTTLKVYSVGEGDVMTLCLHGCGLSARSFGPLAEMLSSSSKVIAFDLPNHGHSSQSTPSLDNLLYCVNEVVNKYKNDRKILLIGHSLGASLAIKSASKLNDVLAVVLIEFYQLNNTDNLISNLPDRFDYDYILRHVCDQRSVSTDFARYCLETQIRQSDDKWGWICNPNDTKRYWEEWYKDATQIFLGLAAYKILILANHIEDSQIIIAHMQGKIQLEIIPNSGHFLHESKADSVASVVRNFLKRIERIKKI